MKKSEAELPKLLVVMGHPRSGTSILNRVCNSHPGIVMTREFSNMILPQSYLEHISMIRKNFFWKTPLLYSQGSLKQKRLNSLFFIIRYLFWLLMYSRGYITAESMQQTLGHLFPKRQLVGDKKPTYLWKVKDFEQPHTHYVLIYRDGRDVVQSALNRSWGRNNTRFSTAKSAAKKWVRAVEIMEHHRKQFHIIRYEDFVNDPKEVLTRLANYLKVDPNGFKPSMVKASSIGKYKVNLSEQELSEVIEIAGPSLEWLGYQLD